MYALIPAAGSGSRLGAAHPKQYVDIAGEPMLVHTVRALLGCRELLGVAVVVQPGDTRAADCLASELARDGRLRIADRGGDTRAASVRGGLQWLRERGAADSDWVVVHDAARCCITHRAVERLIEACRDDQVGGLLALPLADTLKREQAVERAGPRSVRVGATVPRDGLWQAQTPQMFRLGPLLQALRAAGDAAPTDEASAVEAGGLRPLLVPGETSNFKVTLAGDLELADALLRSRRAAGGSLDHA